MRQLMMAAGIVVLVAGGVGRVPDRCFRCPAARERLCRSH